MYITLGKFTDKAPYTSNYKYMKMYFRSIRKKQKDFLITKDYIWRWDTDWFWCSKEFLMQNFTLRLIFGKLLLNSKSYLAIKKFNEKYQVIKKIKSLSKPLKKKQIEKEPVIQDVGIPIENCEKFIDFFYKEIKIKPVWACPMKAYDKNYIFPLFDLNPNNLFIDFGFWDFVAAGKSPYYHNKRIEEILEKLKGIKSLYSTSYYNKKDFWRIYNGKIYFNIKKKYDPKNIFPDLYDKCVKSV